MRLIVIIKTARALVVAGFAGLAGSLMAQSVNSPTPFPESGWPTKGALLEAATRGELNEIVRLRPLSSSAVRQMTPFFMSIKAILHNEYGVPALPDWPGNCRSEFIGAVSRLFQDITQANLSVLSNTAPGFTNPGWRDESNHIRNSLAQLQRPGSYCDTRIGDQMHGQWQAHPYKVAVAQLLPEFGRAQAQWVLAERDRRRTAYAEQQGRIDAQRKAESDAQAQRDADTRAAEQRRIDTERARIEAEQKRRQQQERSRVAG